MVVAKIGYESKIKVRGLETEVRVVEDEEDEELESNGR